LTVIILSNPEVSLMFRSLQVLGLTASLAMSLLTQTAHADSLLITNNTDLASTVRLKTGAMSGSCATSLPGGSNAWTAEHGVRSTPWFQVFGMCTGVWPCRADIYVGAKHNCSGKIIGTAEINGNKEISVTITDPNYSASAGHLSLTINQK